MVDRTTGLEMRFLVQSPASRFYPFVVFHPSLNSFNPSIATHDGAIYFSLRHSNMLASGNMRYFRTFSKTISWNASHPVDETSFGTLQIPPPEGMLGCQFLDARARGFEDLRIFRHRNRWFALATQMSGDIITSPANVMHLLGFDDEFHLNAGAPLPSPTRAPREKNWAPLCRSDELYIVYKPVPLELYRIDLERGQMVPVALGRIPLRDPSAQDSAIVSAMAQFPWSGSSQFVPYEGETQIGVVHRKFVYSDELIYQHAFMKIDANFDTELSRPFHFLSFGIEMCAGLALVEDKLWMSFGSHNDMRGFLCSMPRAEVERLFEAPVH